MPYRAKDGAVINGRHGDTPTRRCLKFIGSVSWRGYPESATLSEITLHLSEMSLCQLRRDYETEHFVQVSKWSGWLSVTAKEFGSREYHLGRLSNGGGFCLVAGTVQQTLHATAIGMLGNFHDVEAGHCDLTRATMDRLSG